MHDKKFYEKKWTLMTINDLRVVKKKIFFVNMNL